MLLLLLPQLFTTDGIPIEPFHLRRERAEGFFDAEGNYVEYRLEPESDAWLDSLGVREI
jgi:CD2 antigen cytoplasmic tail-binding protein 2